MPLATLKFHRTIAGVLGAIGIVFSSSPIPGMAQENQQSQSFSVLFVNAGNDICQQNSCDFLTSFATNTVNELTAGSLPPVELSPRNQWQLSQINDNSEITNEEDWPEPIDDSQTYWFVLLEQLEYRGHEGEDSFNWEALSWVGGDYQRLWIKSEGEVGLEEGHGEAELQLLYGRSIAPFWDLQIGVKYEQLYGDRSDGRAFAVVGVEGLAPYFFEIDAAGFVSQDGDLSARFAAEYELLLSQRLILQPKLETNLALQDVEEFGVGSGLNDINLGLRLRYEFSRQFAPYIGINWNRKFGETAEFAREEGESSDRLSGVAGFRLLF